MGFLDKLRAAMARFMSGRYGADQLSMAMVIAALVVSILGTFTGARAVAMVLSDALLIVAFFRIVQQGQVSPGARKRGLPEQDRGGAARLYGVAQPGEERQEIPLFHLPEVQAPPARAAEQPGPPAPQLRCF